MLSSVILEFCFFPNTHRYVGHLGGFKILVISWRVSLYLYFLLTVLEYNCLHVHVLQVLLPQVCQWRGAGKASQARGFSQLGLAPKTVGLGAGDLYIFLTWKCAERVSLPRSELIPQPDMEGTGKRDRALPHSAPCLYTADTPHGPAKSVPEKLLEGREGGRKVAPSTAHSSFHAG